MPRYAVLLTLLMALLLMAMIAFGCVTIAPQSQNSQEVQETQKAANGHGTLTNEESFAMRDLGVELSNPLELIVGPDDYLWLTERTGKQVTRVNPVDSSVHVALEIAEAYQRALQDGVLGMVLHPELLQGTGNDYVYLAYTYQGEGGSGQQVNRRAKIVRYTYNPATETLGEPFDVLTNLPGSSDHNSAKLAIGIDEKLYYTIGDQGTNQFASACLPNQAQVLPTAEEIAASDWSKYPGKVLRLNLDGSIPTDNPTFEGVQSHIFTYGHRNMQGLVMSDEGLLYGAEHGPKSDDEINLLEAGKNYGWPQVAGYQDDQGYVYGNWSAAEDCAQLQFSDFGIPASVPLQLESEWRDRNFTPPLYTFGTVGNNYDFKIAACAPQEWICWPTVAPTGLTIYVEQEDGIPGWSTSLLATALKTGTVYRMQLDPDGRSISGEPIPYFKTTNRYRDVAVGPDGRTFYVITDSGNWTLGPDGIPTNVLENPGTILEFTYRGGD